MASSFRKIPRRLYCTSYMKSANISFENNIVTSRKPLQHKIVSGENILGTSQFTEKKLPFSRDVYCSKYNLVPLTYSISSNGIISWSHKNGIKVPLSYITDNQQVSMAQLGSSKKKSKVQIPTPQSQGRPSQQQLDFAYNMLSSTLPKVFVTPLLFEQYHPNIILENNIRRTRHYGLKQYVIQVALLKMVVHFKFAYVKFDILKITKHPEDGTIKCRWRIVGIPGMSVILQFWKYKIYQLNEAVDTAPTWYDGFSTYYVGSDGKIYRHVIDKMIPDDDRLEIDSKNPLTPKVALFLGLISSEEQETFKRALDDYLQNSNCLGIFLDDKI